MIPFFESAARRFRQHPSDSDLVLYLDGELTLTARGRVESHCRSCWSCRQRCDELQRGIHDYVAYSRRTAAHGDGDALIRERFLLRLAAEERGRPAPRRGSRSLLRLSWGLPALASLALAGWFAFLAVRPQAVSAAALLRHAALAEQRHSPAVGQAGRLRLARLERDKWSTGFLPISGETAAAPRSFVLENLGSLLQQEDLSGEVGLSAARFEFWAAKLKARLDARPVRMGGQDYWLISARLPRRESGLQEFSLLLRGSDGVVVEERFQFTCNGGKVSFVICAEPYPLPAAAVVPQLVRPLPAAPLKTPQLPASGVEVLQQSTGLAELAIEAHCILREIGFDLSGTVLVVRRSGRVIVSGVVETGAEREALSRAFAVQPLILLEIATVDEAALRPRPQQADVWVDSPAPDEQIAFRKSADQVFRALLAPGLDDKMAYSRIEEFGRGAIRLSAKAVQSAWALRRLHEEFTAGQAGLLDSAHQLLLRDLAAEYESETRQALDQLSVQLRPLLPSPTGEAAPQAPSLTAFPERIDKLARILFAGLPVEPQPLPSLLLELANVLAAAPEEIAARQQAWLGRLTNVPGQAARSTPSERQDP